MIAKIRLLTFPCYMEIFMHPYTLCDLKENLERNLNQVLLPNIIQVFAFHLVYSCAHRSIQ
jgi:hypothetical protein